MAKKKLSTKDILAAARAESGGSQEESPAEDASSSGQPSEPKQPDSQPDASVGAPKSTKDILAAARAQSAGEVSKPAAKPPSTKNILAAGRAQAGAAESSEPATEPAAGKETSKESPAAAAEGKRPSVQEMLKAVREGKPPEAAKQEETPSQPVRPPIPKKPPAKKGAKPQEQPVSRRFVVICLAALVLLFFIGLFVSPWLSLVAVCTLPVAFFPAPFAAACVLFAAASVLGTTAMVRFMLPNVLVEPPSRFKVGPPSDYPPRQVSTKWKAQFGVWMVHTEHEGKSLLFALSTVCTHLGCTPNWLEGEQKFKCPCHGSGFYISGINFEGPAPRPLERHGIRIAEDGMVEVDKSVKFQQEMGQWDNSDSFVVMS